MHCFLNGNMIVAVLVIGWSLALQGAEPDAFLTKHCADCHGADDPEGELSLVDLGPLTNNAAHDGSFNEMLVSLLTSDSFLYRMQSQ